MRAEVEQAETMAARFRRMGYADAQAAPEYCINSIGPDRFYTFTVSVYVGRKSGQEIRPTRNPKVTVSALPTAGYWRSPVHVLSGVCWLAIGLTIGALVFG